ncbi:hypothetical protein AgCh_016854 [Apium graveolens]
MMKRIGTSLECSHCKGVGHNTRTCTKKKLDEGAQTGCENMEEQTRENVAEKRPPRCAYCKEEGHNIRTCSVKALDEKKNKQEADEATNQRAKYEGAQTDNIGRKKSSGSGGGRVKQLAGLSKRSSPLKTSTHAGIVKPSKNQHKHLRFSECKARNSHL